MTSVQIIDRHVQCPSCSCTFAVRRGTRGEGAQYVHNWKKIPSRIMAIKAHWQQLPSKPYSKIRLRSVLQMRGLFMSEYAFAARISEMLGLGMIRVATKEERQTVDYTTKAPMYVLKEHDV